MQETNRAQAALKKLEVGIAQLIHSGNWQAYLRTQSKFHTYSFHNTLLILFQMPQATRVAGFHTWRKLGRSVFKGEKTIWILAPITYKIRNSPADALPPELAEPEGEDEVEILRGFKTVPVYDIAQTAGKPLLDISLQQLQGDDQGLFAALHQFSEFRGWPVAVKPLNHCNGYCHFGTRHIAVDNNLSPLHQAKTLAHEIAHSLMHTPEDYRMHRADKELEAESVAFCVLSHFGLDSQDYSFGYVASWQGGKDAIPKLKECGQRIQAATQQIIAGLEAQVQLQAVSQPDIPEYINYLEERHNAFLDGVAQEYYWQRVEDALKANPPLLPEVEEYMTGYNSLMATDTSQSRAEF